MASRRQEVIVEMKLDKTSLAAVQSEIRQAFALAEQAQQLRQTNGRYFLGGQRISGARADLISQSGEAAEKLLPGLLDTEQHIKSTIDAKIREHEQQQAKYIASLKRLANELQAVKDKIARDAAEKDRMHRQEVKGFPSSSIYEHRKIEQAKQDAQKLAAILHSNVNLTQEQLARVENIYKNHSSVIRRENTELHDIIQSGIVKQKAQLNEKAAIVNKAIAIETHASNEVLRVRRARLAAEKEFDSLAKKVDQDLLSARKFVTSELAKDEARRKRLTGGVNGGRGGRNTLDLGTGVTGRGFISGIAGLGGVNLYGLGALGATAAGTRAALNAYAEVFNTKNVLAGIVQTFSQFKDSGGRPLDRAANFTQSQQYSNYLYGRLRKAAVDSPLTLKELSDVYTTGTPFLARSGVGFEQSIGITNTVASLGKMMGLRLDSIKDDIRAIYEGRFRNVQTFQAAGFTSDDFKKLSNMRGDDLVNFFNEKFSGYQESLKQFAGSFTAQWDRLIDSLYQTAALVGEKIAPAFVSFATDLQDTLTKWSADGTLDRFSKDMGTLLSTVGVALANITQVLATFGAGIGRVGGIIADAIGGVLQMVGVTNGKMTVQDLTGFSIRGIQSMTGGMGEWGPEAKQLLANISGSGLSGDKKRGVLVNALDTLANSRDPASLLQNYTTLKHGIKGAVDVFSLVQRVQDLQGTLPGKGTQDLDFLGQAKYQKNPADFQAYQTWLNVKHGIDSINSATNSKYDYTTTDFPIGQMKTVADLDFIKSGMNIQDLIGMGLAQDVLTKEGITTSSLRAIVANPQSPQAVTMRQRLRALMERERAKFAPDMINTAPKKTVKTPKTHSAGSPSLTQIEPDVTSELQSINDIEAQQFELEKRAARGENISAAYRALEIQKNALERKIALKQANKSSVLVGNSSTQTLASTYQNSLRAFAKASGGKVTLGKMSRTFAEQTALWNAAVKKYGSEKAASKWVARPGTSNHEFGLANDLSYGAGGQAWAHANAAKFGLGFPMSHEPWHVELLGGSKSARLRLQLENKDTVAGNKSGQIDNRFDEKSRALELQRIREEYDKEQEAKRRKREVNLLNLQYTHRKDLSGTDATLQYAAKLKILNAQYPGLERLKPEYRNARAELDDERDAAIKARQEQRDREDQDARQRVLQERMNRDNTAFKNKQAVVGLYGSDLTKALLDQKISKLESGLGEGGLATAWARVMLPALYEQRKALDKNTDAINKQISTKFDTAVKGIFGAPEFLSPSQTYRRSFDKKIEAIENMSSSDLNAYRASLGMAGIGYTDDQLRGMLKLQATKGFSSQGFRSMQHRDQLFGGANAFLGALQSGGDPIAAFAGAYQNIDGQDAQQRLLQGLFNRGSYQRMQLAGVSKYGPIFKRGFDKGAFNKDLIAGGGSLVANMLVGTMGGQAQTGSQIGGMLAPLLFTGLGAWAGPLGILGGGLIGSLFGKKKQIDPSIEQHRKRLEELLQSINNRLKPQEDFYRTIKGSVLWGSASRSFGGRASSLGARVALGVI